MAFFRLVLVLLACACAAAQGPPRPGPDAHGPWEGDVAVFRVRPGGAVERTATFERAGVATVARLADGRLLAAHQHFPENKPADFDKVAVRFSSNEGKTWSAPRVIRLAGLPAGMRFPFDPTLVPLAGGAVRLYFTSTRGRRLETGAPAIYSAISKDGVHYTFEPGVRFGIEGRIVIDCAAVFHDGLFHIFVPDNGPIRAPKPRLRQGPEPRQGPGPEPRRERDSAGSAYHAVSSDGLKFTRLEDVKIPGRRRWLGGARSDGKRILFYGTGEGLPRGDGRPRGGIWVAASEDGTTWKLVAGLEIPGADPGAAVTADGGLVVVATVRRVRHERAERPRGEGRR